MFVHTELSARSWRAVEGREALWAWSQRVVPGCDLPPFESGSLFLLPVLQHCQDTQHPDPE